MRILYSEWLKTKHTLIRWFILFLPVLIAVSVILYLINRDNVSFPMLYQIYFTLCSSIWIPIGSSVLTGFYVQEEEFAGNFHGLLSSGLSRKKIYLSKFVFSALSLTISSLLATLIISAGLHLLLPQNFPAGSFLLASLLILSGALPVLAIHIWISFALGIGASVGAGILGLLIAVLMGTTNLGDAVWYFLPWTYPVKLFSFPLALSIMPGTAAAPAVLQFLLCLALSLLLCVVFLLSGMLWFEKWEGRKHTE